MFQTTLASPLRMRHGMRMGVGNGRSPLSDDQIKRFAPSVFAETPWQSMTSKYLFIPTVEIVQAMRKEGFEVVQALQGNSRIEGKADFTKHMLRFALPQAQQVNGSVPELVLINSHDGTTSYRLMMGVFRMICQNGLLMASNVIEDLKFRHSKSLADEIIDGTGTLVREIPRVNDQIERLSEIKLLPREMAAFATAAHSLRWEPGQAPVEASQLLNARRIEDRAPDLYTTLNVVQENIMKGGLRGMTSTKKPTTTRAVQGVTENVRLNQALSVLASELARHKAN